MTPVGPYSKTHLYCQLHFTTPHSQPRSCYCVIPNIVGYPAVIDSFPLLYGPLPIVVGAFPFDYPYDIPLTLLVGDLVVYPTFPLLQPVALVVVVTPLVLVIVDTVVAIAFGVPLCPVTLLRLYPFDPLCRLTTCQFDYRQLCLLNVPV